MDSMDPWFSRVTKESRIKVSKIMILRINLCNTIYKYNAKLNDKIYFFSSFHFRIFDITLKKED